MTIENEVLKLPSICQPFPSEVDSQAVASVTSTFNRRFHSAWTECIGNRRTRKSFLSHPAPGDALVLSCLAHTKIEEFSIYFPTFKGVRRL